MAGRRNRARRHVPDGPFDAHIDDLAHDARGIARVDGKVVFITDALPGEDVRYMRTGKRSSFDQGRLEELLKASADRIEPGCEYFGVCGGCSLQHLDPVAQVAFKQTQMLETLRRIGGVQPVEAVDPLRGPVWGYRRRARLGVKHVPAKERVLVGFRERDNPYITVMDNCEVLDPDIGQRLLKLANLIQKLSIRDRLPQIEVAVADNAVALVLRILDPLTTHDKDLLEQFSIDESVWFYLQSGGVDSVRPLLKNTPELFYQLMAHDVTVYFEPADFIQINGELNAKMVDLALAWLDPHESDEVLELFSGLGNFSMPLAKLCRQVVAVEGDAKLVSRARDNACRNDLTNIEFHTADLFIDHVGSDWAQRKYDKALIDPPRAGAEAMMPLLARAGIREILYVSCHPATLARDVSLLVKDYGYRLQRVTVMDMFPHTSHVESMALLVKE